jgi:signal transduction histidine kinase
MEIPVKKYDLRSVLSILLLTMGFNTAIAFILTAVGYGGGFRVNLIFSQCMGLSICITMIAALHFGRAVNGPAQWLLASGALLGGAALGLLTGSLVTEKEFFLTPGNYRDAAGVLAVSVLFGIAASYYFFSREQIARSRSRLQEERIQRLTTEKQMAETHLKLLQAQIEPHFLYNTLANILSLMETDIDQASAMLTDLSRYLRATLVRTRQARATIGQEMAVVQAYVNIFQRRMGDRLKCRVDVADHVQSHPFPPLVVQPLVENAIRHGIEPLIEGGRITVQVEEADDKLRVRVMDTGRGIAGESHPDGGLGLVNIRERLEAIYGSRARLIMEENQPSGIKATIEVPYEAV